MNRSYPSLGSLNEHVILNEPIPNNEWEWSYHKKTLSYRDLFMLATFRNIGWQKLTLEKTNLVAAKEPEHAWYEKKEVQSLNPDFLLLASVNYYGDYPPDSYPEDWRIGLEMKEGI